MNRRQFLFAPLVLIVPPVATTCAIRFAITTTDAESFAEALACNAELVRGAIRDGIEAAVRGDSAERFIDGLRELEPPLRAIYARRGLPLT